MNIDNMIKTKDIKLALCGTFDTFSLRNGEYTVKKSYYWGIDSDGSTLANKVKKIIPEAIVTDYGNHWHPFVGGAKAGSPKDSYLYCKFKL
jgi:hypothetical protein